MEDVEARHPRERLFHDGLRMRIAVVAGVAQQRAVAAQQGEIDTPGIDAESVEWAVLARAQPQRLQHLAVQSQGIPMQRVEGAHRPVGEAVNHFQTQLRTIE